MPPAAAQDGVAAPFEPLQRRLHRAEGQAEAVLELLPGDALGQAEPQHQIFHIPLSGRDSFIFREDVPLGLHPQAVGVQVPDAGVAHVPQVGVGPGAEARVLPQGPVFQIVP